MGKEPALDAPAQPGEHRHGAAAVALAPLQVERVRYDGIPMAIGLRN
jgi:hypothetical protein